jgi:hypothetical protein
MGMDLHVMLLVGPLNLSKNRALTKKLLAKADAIVAKVQPSDDCDCDIDECNCDIDERESDDPEEEALANCFPSEVLENLHQLWQGKLFRDVNTRVIRVGGESRRIVAAGGDTWGEEVSGEGYQCLRLADMLGFIKALGIK